MLNIRPLFRQFSNAVVLPKPTTPLCAPFVVTHNAKPARGPLYQFFQFYPSSSSTRWRTRQARDRFAKEAKVQGLKSRAAFKLLEIDSKYRIFSPGQTVIDLGYAPGSWSQVAVTKTSPGGRVVGIDIIPAQPPKGVSTIQGNFLSPEIRAEVKAYVQDPQRGRPKKRIAMYRHEDANEQDTEISQQELEELERGYIDLERAARLDTCEDDGMNEKLKDGEEGKQSTSKGKDNAQGRAVDVVLSDMSAPWDQTTGLWVNSISNPYNRMMNTSGIAFRDHAGSMDLCMAALTFCFDTLRTGGNFVCKFYQGAEDKALEKKLKVLFEKVHREKPESSRNESKEAYFVALRRKETPERDEVFK